MGGKRIRSNPLTNRKQNKSIKRWRIETSIHKRGISTGQQRTGNKFLREMDKKCSNGSIKLWKRKSNRKNGNSRGDLGKKGGASLTE